jgi:hypothetical protein
MRPSHIDALVPLVQALYFVPTPQALEASRIEASQAFSESMAWMHRWSLLRWLWGRFDGNTASH